MCLPTVLQASSAGEGLRCASGVLPLGGLGIALLLPSPAAARGGCLTGWFVSIKGHP